MLPQHSTLPSGRKAQVCDPPALTCVALSAPNVVQEPLAAEARAAKRTFMATTKAIARHTQP
jgi:hypothetical protein